MGDLRPAAANRSWLSSMQIFDRAIAKGQDNESFGFHRQVGIELHLHGGFSGTSPPYRRTRHDVLHRLEIKQLSFASAFSFSTIAQGRPAVHLSDRFSH